MTVSVRQVTTLLAAGAIALAVVGFAYAIQYAPDDPNGLAPYAPAALIRLFDLDTEGNVPTWYQSVLLLFAATMCALFVATRPATGATSWRVLAVGFLVMSCDESAGLHEFAGRYISAHVGAAGLNVYYWLIPGGLAAAAIVLFARRARAALDARARRGVLLAGALFFAGALGLELIEALFDARLYGTAPFGALAWAEESLEMAGVVVFIHALMAQLRDRGQAVGVVFAA